MGLYDNYKLSYSQGVVPFVGSIVPELRAVKQEMDAASRKTLETTDGVETLMSTVAVNDFDKPEHDRLLQETKQGLDAIRSGNLAYGQDAARKLASQVTSRLNGLAVRRKQLEAAEESWSKEGADVATQEYLKDLTARVNGPAQFDDYGRVAPLEIPKHAKPVSDMEMIQKGILSVIKAKGYQFSNETAPLDAVRTADGSYTVKVGNSYIGVTADELKEGVDRAMSIDQGWRESLEQSARAQAYKETKKYSDEEINNVVGNPSSLIGQQASQLMGADPNLSARDAFETVLAEGQKQNKVKQLKDYAALGAYSQESSDVSYNVMTSKKDGEGDDDPSLSDELSYTGNFSANALATGIAQQTGKDIRTSLETYNSEASNVDAEIAKYQAQVTQLEATGGPDYNNALSKLEKLQAQKSEIETKKAIASAAEERILDQVTREHTKGWRGGSRSWKQQLNSTVKDVSEKLVKNGMPQKEAEEVVSSFVRGNYNVELGPMTAGEKERPVMYRINGKIYGKGVFNTLTKGSEDASIIRKKAEEVKDNAPNMLTGGLPLVSKIKESARASLPFGTYYDMANNPIDAEELQQINFKEAEPLAYIDKADRILVVTKEGKPYLIDAASTGVRQGIARDLAHNKKIKNPDLVRRGRNLELNNAPVYERAYGTGTAVVPGHPASGPIDPKDPKKGYKTPIKIGGKEYGVQRTPENDFVFVNLATNKSEEMVYNSSGAKKRNFSFGELETILNRMLE